MAVVKRGGLRESNRKRKPGLTLISKPGDRRFTLRWVGAWRPPTTSHSALLEVADWSFTAEAGSLKRKRDPFESAARKPLSDQVKPGSSGLGPPRNLPVAWAEARWDEAAKHKTARSLEGNAKDLDSQSLCSLAVAQPDFSYP